ncbi:MAG TPA: ABC transporter ATP-binding protein [Negativicutes bacterium]|nr:ABC transporter ATP-binding protein [Negativicutes bacterium]
METLLSVKDLQISFQTNQTKLIGTDKISFDVKANETVGIVGESGCGKSITSLSIMRLLGRNAEISHGQIVFDGVDLLSLPEKEMRRLRGKEISMIFQEPMSSLNPVFTIGDQLIEAIRLHLHFNQQQAKELALSWLKKVGIARAEQLFHEYPHSLSGGMRQRVMIAMVLSCSPKLLIADEPTTALDVTIQAQILALMKSLQKSSGMSILLITHDLGVVAEMADRVIVMYAGQIVEHADVFTLFDDPQHPYTKGLMNSIPQLGETEQVKIESIPGMVPRLDTMPDGCRFRPRCRVATEECAHENPPLIQRSPGHVVRCRFAGLDKGEQNGK